MRWKYYNHAAVPLGAPHEEPDLEALEDGSVWGIPGKPLLARWTTDFDCQEETNWWYLIKDAPIEIEELSNHSKKHIRQGLNRCDIRVIEYKKWEEIYEVFKLACENYRGLIKTESKENFYETCINSKKFVFWGAYERNSQKLIGYLMVKEYLEYVEILTAKFNPQYLCTHMSDALYYTIINWYMDKAGIKYISSGQRNINHVTNTQEYKIKTFGYRKAYCRLHIKYRAWLGIFVCVIYPFRKVFSLFDRYHCFHLLNSILHMEEICRGNRENKKRE
ncbi:MAG: hypothetical protein MJZ34_14000 [Paludibacteraceae bacterium]|nr:hypothetical protein [Paludibacteraceae bacterium]